MIDTAEALVTRANKMIEAYSDTEKQIKELESKNAKEQSILDRIREARTIAKTVLSGTQVGFKLDIEKLMTLAIKSIFHRFEFELEWKELKSRTDLNFNIRDGNDTYELEGDLGGSILDVISFASRPVFHKYQPIRTRKILFFDEAFKWIGRGDFQRRAAELIRMVALEQGYQIIFITHDENYKVIANRMFQVTNKGNHSTVNSLS